MRICTAKASPISRETVKWGCAREWGGWGRLSEDGPGQHNPDRSEGPLPYGALVAGRVVLVLGAEGKGLRPRVAAACDQLVALPVRGRVGSLNVSTAAAALVLVLGAGHCRDDENEGQDQGEDGSHRLFKVPEHGGIKRIGPSRPAVNVSTCPGGS